MAHRMKNLQVFFSVIVLGLSMRIAEGAVEAALRPRVVGDWWQIAASPNLAELTTTHQQRVVFGIGQPADGSWQLWSCVRGTKEPGHTRLLHRWEGATLTNTNWKPMG